MKISNLNTNEAAVLNAIILSSVDESGGEFTYFEYVSRFLKIDLTDPQLKGYVSSLIKKDLICVCEESKMITNTRKVEYLNNYIVVAN